MWPMRIAILISILLLIKAESREQKLFAQSGIFLSKKQRLLGIGSFWPAILMFVILFFMTFLEMENV